MSDPKKGQTDVFFRYVDDGGRTHLVSDLSAVPEAYRDQAEEIAMRAGENAYEVEDVAETAKKLKDKAIELKDVGLERAKQLESELADVPFVGDLHVPSVAVGFALSFVAFLALSLAWKTGRFLLKVAVVVILIALVAGAYFGGIRQAVGLGDASLSSPADLLDDAKAAAAAANRRIEARDGALREAEEGSR